MKIFVSHQKADSELAGKISVTLLLRINLIAISI